VLRQAYSFVSLTSTRALIERRERLGFSYGVFRGAHFEHVAPVVMPDWLSETIIPVPMIEGFKEEVKEKGLF